MVDFTLKDLGLNFAQIMLKLLPGTLGNQVDTWETSKL